MLGPFLNKKMVIISQLEWVIFETTIDYESNGHRNKDLSLKEYVKETKPYLKDILTDLQKSGP